MSIEDYLRPIEIATRTQFKSTTAAARHMTAQGRGVIMAITATPSRLALPSSYPGPVLFRSRLPEASAVPSVSGPCPSLTSLANDGPPDH